MISVLLTLLLTVALSDALSYLGYPPCAQPILYAETPTGCTLASSAGVEALNACLCYDGDFLPRVARKVYLKCGEDALLQTARKADVLCKRTSTSFEGGRERLVCRGLGLGLEGEACVKYCEEHYALLHGGEDDGTGGFRGWARDILADVTLLLRIARRLGWRLVGFRV